MIANGYRVSFWGDENVLELAMMVAQHLNRLCTLEKNEFDSL